MVFTPRFYFNVSMESVAVVSVALDCYKSGSLSPPSSLRRARNHVTKSILILNYSARLFTRVCASVSYIGSTKNAIVIYLKPGYKVQMLNF